MLSNTQIKLIRSLQLKKYRDQTGLFVAEGEKCINELKNGFELVMLITQKDATEKQISQLSSLQHPQGQIAVFRKRQNTNLQQFNNDNNKDHLILALDGIQDPGNLGTIIRTADWYGVTQIVCSPTTADCYNPKVVQATMGALARVNIIYTDLAAFLEQTRKVKPQIPIYGTLLNGKNLNTEKLTNGIIIMGNEGNGISEQVRPFITHPLLIPSYPPNRPTVESLNVAIATGITLDHFRNSGKS